MRLEYARGAFSTREHHARSPLESLIITSEKGVLDGSRSTAMNTPFSR